MDTNWIQVPEAAERLGISEEMVRKHIRSGNLFAKRSGRGNRSAWLLDAEQIEREAILRGHQDDLRAHGVVVGRGEAFHEAVEAEHGPDVATQVRDLADRHELLEQAAAEVDSHRAELGLQFTALDDADAIEREAQAIAKAFRRREQIFRRAQEILDEDDDQ